MTRTPLIVTVQSHSYIIGGRNLDGWVLIGIGVLIWVGWILVAARHWQNILQSDTRLGYFIGDVFLLAPGCVLSGYGLVTDKPWGPPTLLIAIGAAAFDLTHTLIWLCEIGWPKIGNETLPSWVYGIAILVVLAFLEWLAWREIKLETGTSLAAWLFVPSMVLLLAAFIFGTWARRKVRPSSGRPAG